ncbi:MAG: hypothetical protein HC938_17260 [Nitrospira sp.]|nr:hypothetical protein [Nitrospira sp.]
MVLVRVLKIIGVFWALVGIANILVGTYSGPTPLPTFSIMSNVALFIIPGLLIYGIGEWNTRKLHR